jgi:hypothetical protein
MRTIFVLVAPACLALACGGSALPQPKVTEAESAVSAANAVGAQNNPQGALHLKMARDQLAEAKAMIQNGDEEEARLVLEGAEADAELALMLTREQQARAEATEAAHSVRDLKQGD